jgi:hypothetical protein
MKSIFIAVFSLVLSGCSKVVFAPPHTDKQVHVVLADTIHVTGGGGTIATNKGESAAEFSSEGTFYQSQEVYRVKNPTASGFTLVYDISITRASTSTPKKYEGYLEVPYTQVAKKTLDSDFALSVKTQ